jgi:hypothetical protein
MSFNLCGAIGDNTGEVDCDITRGNPIKIAPGGATFSSSDYADQTTMDAAILTKLLLPNGNSQKLYPFPVIQGTTDQTEAAKTGSLGYGLKIKLLRSKPGYEFDVLAGTSLEKRLIAFDGQIIPLYILDDKSQFAGVKDSSGTFKGANYLIGVEPRPYGDAQNPKTTKITISIVDTQDFTENAYFYKTALSSSSIVGLKNVVLSEPSAHSTNVYKIKMKIPTSVLGGDLDIYDDFGTAIAALTFTAGTGASYGASLAITSVAVDATLKALTVTFDSTAFTALASGTKIKLTPPTPAVLDAADVTGIELLPIILTK